MKKIAEFRLTDPEGDGVVILVEIDHKFFLIAGEDIENGERVHIGDSIEDALSEYSTFVMARCHEYTLTDEELELLDEERRKAYEEQS